MNSSFFSSRRTLRAVAGLIGASIALSGAPAFAQQSEIDLLRQQLAELQARLDKLETNQTTAAATIKTNTPTAASNSKTPIVIGGLLQLQPLTFLDQDRTAGKLADTFRIRRGEIRITAPTITPRISGTAMFDLAKTNNTTNAGSLLQEIVIAYNFDKSANAPKFIDIGQFKPGFGFESDLVSSGALQTTERALFYSFRDLAAASAPTLAIDPDGPAGPLLPFPSVASGLPAPRPGGGLGDSRDQGLRLRGSFANSTIAYNVGVFNGIGERQNGTAGGDPKAYVARLIYRPTDTGLQIGVSGLRANTRGDATGTALERDGYGAFLAYKKDKINFQAEYAELNSERRNNNTFFRNGTGYYAGLGYLISPKFELVGRYDTLKVDARGGVPAATETTTKEYTLGANYYIKGNNAKIQANIVKVDDNLAAAGTSDGLQLRTNFQVAF